MSTKKKTTKRQKPLNEQLAKQAVAGMSEALLKKIVIRGIRIEIKDAIDRASYGTRRDVGDRLEITVKKLLKSGEFNDLFEAAAKKLIEQQFKDLLC